MGRPKIPLLHPPLVVKAALQIIDVDGLDGFSVRRLADEFNVHVGSLYKHFNNKEEILRQVCERILREVDPPDPHAEDWRDLMVGTTTSYRRVVIRHHNAIPVVLRYEPHSLAPDMFGPYRDLLCVRGVPDDMVLPMMKAFDVLVLGSLALHAAQVTSGDEKVLRSRNALRQAEEEFEYQCRSLADGFAAQIQDRDHDPTRTTTLV